MNLDSFSSNARGKINSLGLWNTPIETGCGSGSTVTTGGTAMTTQSYIDDDGKTQYTSYNNSGTFADFASFQRSLQKRGLGSLELLALELKTRGSLMARYVLALDY